MKAEKCETHADFIKRLNRTACNLPASLINDAVGSLQNRCRLLLKAKGGLFVEGGRKRRPFVSSWQKVVRAAASSYKKDVHAFAIVCGFLHAQCLPTNTVKVTGGGQKFATFERHGLL